MLFFFCQVKQTCVLSAAAPEVDGLPDFKANKMSCLRVCHFYDLFNTRFGARDFHLVMTFGAVFVCLLIHTHSEF